MKKKATRVKRSVKRRLHRATTYTYTHTDANGMRWRMSSNRPVSELADKTMADCGLKPL